MMYKDFQYERHEWDNIPIIVPRFIIYMSKYVKGLSSFAKRQSEMETTEELRRDLDRRYEVPIICLNDANLESDGSLGS